MSFYIINYILRTNEWISSNTYLQFSIDNALCQSAPVSCCVLFGKYSFDMVAQTFWETFLLMSVISLKRHLTLIPQQRKGLYWIRLGKVEDYQEKIGDISFVFIQVKSNNLYSPVYCLQLMVEEQVKFSERMKGIIFVTTKLRCPMPDGLLFISTRTENIPSQILDNSQEKMEALCIIIGLSNKYLL